MQLTNSLFKILDYKTTEKGLVATIELDPTHIVYVGHFPGQPVTPGVVQMQIVNELLDHFLERKMKIKTLAQAKFLNVLNPEEISQMTIHIEQYSKEELIRLKAWGENSLGTLFKLNADYCTFLEGG